MWSHLVVGDDIISQLEPRRQYIGQLELLAAVAVYSTFGSDLVGWEVVHYNQTRVVTMVVTGVYYRNELLVHY